ncbi:hypothetical protein BCR44DRAFT_1440263, partial [Catenaria anguillulae PL171]
QTCTSCSSSYSGKSAVGKSNGGLFQPIYEWREYPSTKVFRDSSCCQPGCSSLAATLDSGLAATWLRLAPHQVWTAIGGLSPPALSD